MPKLISHCLLSIILTLPSISYAASFISLPFFSATDTEKLRLEIAEPYLDIRTGPGANYPIFYVAQRKQQIEIQKRRNDWFKVTLKIDSERKKTGWVHRDSIGLSLIANGRIENEKLANGDSAINQDEIVLAKDDPRISSLFNPSLYVGFSYGRMSAADLVGIYAGKQLTKSISAEIQAGEFLGRNAEGNTYAGALSFAPFPKWRLAPFAQIGAGAIRSTARGTNSQQNNGSDKFLQSGLGLNLLLSDRYRLRFEYRHLNVLTNTDQNEELETWHIGFSGYF